MLYVDHILCLTLSAPAARRQAAHLAQHLGATLHVLPHPQSQWHSGSTAAQNEWEPRKGRLRSEERETTPTTTTEPPPDTMAGVLEYATAKNIDLVVADTPPDRGPVPPLAADTTQPLLQHLNCPIFTVGHREDPRTIHDLLVPTDLSEHSLRAFRHAVCLARLYDAAVHVLHVIDSLPYVALTPTDRLSLGPTPLSEHRGQRQLQAFLGEEDTADVPIHPHLAYGDPANQIAHAANQNDTDLMVLSSHGGGRSPHVALGKVTESVLGRTTCPLFLLPAFGTSLLAPPTSSGTGAPAP